MSWFIQVRLFAAWRDFIFYHDIRPDPGCSRQTARQEFCRFGTDSFLETILKSEVLRWNFNSLCHYHFYIKFKKQIFYSFPNRRMRIANFVGINWTPRMVLMQSFDSHCARNCALLLRVAHSGWFLTIPKTTNV